MRKFKPYELPDCLTKRPLKFGDKEQIKAIKKLERKAEAYEQEENLEIKKVYKITARVNEEVTKKVAAYCKEEAQEQINIEDFPLCNMKFSTEPIRVVKENEQFNKDNEFWEAIQE